MKPLRVKPPSALPFQVICNHAHQLDGGPSKPFSACAYSHRICITLFCEAFFPIKGITLVRVSLYWSGFS